MLEYNVFTVVRPVVIPNYLDIDHYMISFCNIHILLHGLYVSVSVSVSVCVCVRVRSVTESL